MVLTSTSPVGTSVASEPSRTVGAGRMPLDRRHGLGGAFGRADEQGDLGGPRFDEGQAGRGGRRAGSEDRGRRQRAVPPLAQRRQRSREVGVVGVHLSVDQDQRVGGADQRGPVADPVGQRHRLPLERHRERQPAPGRVELAQVSLEPARGHPHGVVRPVQPERGVARRGAAPATTSGRSGRRARRTSTQQRPSLSSHHSREPRSVRVVLGLRRCERGLTGVEVDRDEEAVALVRRVQRGFHRGPAGCGDRARREARGRGRCCTASRTRAPRRR